MKLLTKIKNKIIHWCGGYTRQEKLVVTTIQYPVKHLQFSYKYFLGTPRELIDKKMAQSFADAILQDKLYESRTINSCETPELLNTTYSIYIVDKSEEIKYESTNGK